MIDGHSPARDYLDEPQPRQCRQLARAFAADGRTVSELAHQLGTSPMHAWWLSDYTAVNDLASA